MMIEDWHRIVHWLMCRLTLAIQGSMKHGVESAGCLGKRSAAWVLVKCCGGEQQRCCGKVQSEHGEGRSASEVYSLDLEGTLGVYIALHFIKYFLEL